MRYLGLALFLFACLPAPFAGEADQWDRYENHEGNFSVLFPEKPSDTQTEDQSDKISHLIAAASEDVRYGVMYVITKEEQPVNEGALKVYREAFLKQLPACDLAKEDAPTPVLEGFVGHLYQMNCNFGDKKFSWIGNLYWGKHYAYAVYSVFLSSSSEPPGIRKFLNSFALLGAAK